MEIKRKQEVNDESSNDQNMCWLLLADVPTGTVIGLDANIWVVRPNFRGVRDIPAGVHYFFYNATSTASNDKSVSGLRCSQFIHFSEPRVIRKRWVKEREEFEDQPDGNVESMLSNQLEVAAYLAAYPRDRFAIWVALASHITLGTVQRLQPSGGWIYSCAQLRSEKSNSQDRAALPIPSRLKRGEEADMEISPPESIQKGEELLPILKTLPETDIHWTPIPQHPLYPPGSTSPEISQHNIDQTYTLNYIISCFDTLNDEERENGGRRLSALSHGESRLLAEFHFAFVVFLLGEVLEGWFHWRKLLALLANCEEAVRERPFFYKALITSLYRLLTYSSEEKPQTNAGSSNSVGVAGLFQAGTEANGGFAFFDGWKECDANEPAFLPYTMMRLFENITEAAEVAGKGNHQVKDVLERAEGLRACLERRFDVKLTTYRRIRSGEIPVEEVDWDTDEAPAIVMD